MERRISEEERGVMHCRERAKFTKYLTSRLPDSSRGCYILQKTGYWSIFWRSLAFLCLCLMKGMAAVLHYQTVRGIKKKNKEDRVDRQRDWMVSVPVSNFHPAQQILSDESREQGCEWKWLVEQKDEQRKREIDREREGMHCKKKPTLTTHLVSHTFLNLS